MTRPLLPVAVALGALIVAGSCKAPRQEAPSKPPLLVLGVVELSDGIPSRYYVGSGENCVITPSVLHDDRLDLEVAFDRREATGEQTRLASTRVKTVAGRPVEVSFRFIRFTFTPRIKK